MGLLFEALDDALGTTSKVRLLRALLRLPHAVTGREAARLARVSQTAARRALDDLVALGILERMIGAGEHRYVLNRDNVLVRQALPPLFAAEDDWSRAVIETIREAFTAGSREPGARPRAVAVLDAATPHGTVTLVIVVASKAAAREADATAATLAPRIRNRFGLRLEPAILALDRLRDLHASGDPLVVRAVGSAIPISGDPLERLVQAPMP